MLKTKSLRNRCMQLVENLYPTMKRDTSYKGATFCINHVDYITSDLLGEAPHTFLNCSWDLNRFAIMILL